MAIYQLRTISKIYKVGGKDFYALKDLSLYFEDAGLISIVGKSGSGKSTLLNILMGIEKPSNGKVLFFGKDISKYNDSQLSNYHLNDCSMVYQHYNLIEDISPLNNVCLPLMMRGENSRKTRRKATQLFKKFDLEYLINADTKTLSGGEKQRVAILRSLIIEPRVILCDEPTGALDTKNSKLVMDIFKEISKTRLVIMVSHDKKLVETYSDRIITLKDGEILSNREYSRVKNNKGVPKNKYRYSNKWNKFFVRNNLKHNGKRNLFAFLSTTFGFITILLTSGYINGQIQNKYEPLKQSLSSEKFTISKKEYYAIENSPLSFEKSTLPDVEVVNELIDINKAIVTRNYDYIFSPNPEMSLDRTPISNYEMCPVYDFSSFKGILIDGRFPDHSSFDEVVVNEKFVTDEDVTSPLHKQLTISYETTIKYPTGEIDNPFVTDQISYTYSFKIVGIVKEFYFLNTPKIYYSFQNLEEELSLYRVENLSTYKEKEVTICDLFELFGPSSDVTSHSYNVFVLKSNNLLDFYNLKYELESNNSDIRIDSTYFDIVNSYITFNDAFSYALITFAIIAFIGVNFIIAMLSFSSFIEKKKEMAILTCLGSKFGSQLSISIKENFLIILLAYGIALGISFIAQYILRLLPFFKYYFSLHIAIPYDQIFGIKGIFLPLLLVVALFISFIFIVVPQLIYKSRSLSEELRDE